MTETNKEVTLADFEIRYANIRKHYPKIENCSVNGCKNPVDITEGMGKDTTCAYHRILFDIWACEVDGHDFERFCSHIKNQRDRRAAFTRWRNKIGKDACDKLVLREAQSGINWVC
jgi:hypothetical protein